MTVEEVDKILQERFNGNLEKMLDQMEEDFLKINNIKEENTDVEQD